MFRLVSIFLPFFISISCNVVAKLNIFQTDSNSNSSEVAQTGICMNNKCAHKTIDASKKTAAADGYAK